MHALVTISRWGRVLFSTPNVQKCGIIVTVTSPSVTITSSLQVGVDTICNNDTLTLVCHVDEQVQRITWYWHSQSQQGKDLKVLATPIKTIYTCVASDHNGVLDEANITVLANGEKLYICG